MQKKNWIYDMKLFVSFIFFEKFRYTYMYIYLYILYLYTIANKVKILHNMYVRRLHGMY